MRCRFFEKGILPVLGRRPIPLPDQPLLVAALVQLVSVSSETDTWHEQMDSEIGCRYWRLNDLGWEKKMDFFDSIIQIHTCSWSNLVEEVGVKFLWPDPVSWHALGNITKQ